MLSSMSCNIFGKMFRAEVGLIELYSMLSNMTVMACMAYSYDIHDIIRDLLCHITFMQHNISVLLNDIVYITLLNSNVI